MSEYTKAPWEWRKVGDSWLLWGFHGMRPIILDVGAVRGKARGRRVLRMRNDGLMEEASPDHPDARLVAAAPLLLEACEAAYKDCCDDGWEDSTLAKVLKAALAAAKP